MRFDAWTLALQTVNFAILVWLLQRFLYQPVLRLVDARRAEVEKQQADARAAERAAQDRLAAIEAERAGIAAERDAALRAAAAQAAELAEARRARAEQEAEALLAAARKTLAGERAQALAEARRAALDLGATFAQRILAEMPAGIRAEAWIERIEHYLAGLAPPDRDALVRRLADGPALTVVTATPLPEPTADAWRERIRRQLDGGGGGGGVAIAFAVDPDLVAGAELHFPGAIVRFSWRSALAAMRAEVEDGNAR